MTELEKKKANKTFVYTVITTIIILGIIIWRIKTSV